MSKPNLLGFSSSLGIYRNKRIMDLERLLSKSLPVKIEMSRMAPMLFQVVMAYAGENQIDGNFEGYATDDWCRIFATNNVPVTPAQATAIIKGFNEVGLLDKGKIRSWLKYNRHLGDYDSIVRAKRLAGKLSAKKRQQEARASLKNSTGNGEITAPKAVKKPSQNASASGQLWVIEQALKEAKGGARKDLLAQRKKLLSQSTGVDLSEPAPSPAPLPERPKPSAKEFERVCLANGKELLESYPDLLTEPMVKALVKHNVNLPDAVRRKFAKLLAELDEGNNPVPG